MHKIPVTVITGFLGSGKTTLVRQLLQNNQGRRIAVLVNEFGEIGIDGELLRSCLVCDETEEPQNNIIELTNGCLCCTVQEEFYPTMQTLLERRDQLDCIVIETSGLALPKPLLQAFRWQEIRNGATVDGVVTVVDCAALVAGSLGSNLAAIADQRTADPNLDHETPLEELFEDQLACADLVLLTKTDLVDLTKVNEITAWLAEQVPKGVKIIPCAQGIIAPELLLGFNAAVENQLDSRPSHHDDEDDHDHDEQLHSIHLVEDKAVKVEELVPKLQKLLQTEEIYRLKGFVHVAQKPMRLVVQGVGNRLETYYDRPWTASEKRQTRLVLIGKELNQIAISQAILNR